MRLRRCSESCTRTLRFVGLTYTNEEKRRQNRDDWDEWSKAVQRIYFRPNVLLAGRRQGTPVVYVHRMAEDFKYMARNSLIGTDFDSCCHNWATQGLNYYVCAKLHWNPDLDVDALIDDYCRSGFGSGAQAVKKYFLRIEKITDEIAEKQLKITEPYTPEIITELRGYLDEAADASKDETDAHKRVAFPKRQSREFALPSTTTGSFPAMSSRITISPSTWQPSHGAVGVSLVATTGANRRQKSASRLRANDEPN